ncbi:uncharacterized protein LOC115374795 [Myripristis murdjan]|uniref:uncharacterized protein LOC115374795 n=1 Tax=Myripristis murdjan TaxID=586833 RepID=UPI001175F686|nr:uncharacterized protein LOC115374795 [Myripristis murdjan]
MELQEQQSDRKELEETLVKLEQHKDKLVQQIKMTRQQCCEESQQILSLQAEEVQKESQIEEYERELARARWRLKKLREEVKHAKRRVEEAGERNTPLQDSIRQSYEEILQEEHTLCSLSGGAVTPQSQLEDSTSPADTMEDEPLPVRPWGRSQSLPAYADLIMRASDSSFCNNLAETREEAEDSSDSTPKIDRSEVEDNIEEEERENKAEEEKREKEELNTNPNPISHLDFYQADPFINCQTEHDLFNEDLFPKTDSSDAFAADPFKGTDPFAADILFPEAGDHLDEGAANVCDEVDTSLSCAENKASTGTQCFESEFPDEDSDIEISYSREDLDAIAMDATSTDEVLGFRPIQSSSEELGPEPKQGWGSQGQYSVESDPNGYELDLGAVSPPSDIEELSLVSLPGQSTTEAAGPEQDLNSDLAHTDPELQNNPGGAGSEPVVSEQDWTDLGTTGHSLHHEATSSQEAEWDIKGEHQNPVTPQNSLDSQNPLVQTEQNRDLSFELSYEPASQASFDPYGFKLSPEHSSHNLLDPDEAELSPEANDPDLAFDTEPSSSQPDQLNFDPYGFDLTSSQMVHQDVFDPYGFKLSPEEENQEVLEICGHDNQNVMDLCSYDNQEQAEPCNYSNQEVLEPYAHDNQEVLEPCSQGNQELLDFCSNENQEVLNLGSHDNQEVLDLLSKEVVPEANNNNPCVLEKEFSGNTTNTSSDSDLASEVSNCPATMDLLGLELSNTSICTTNTTNNTNTADPLNMAASQDLGTLNMPPNQDPATFNVPTSHNLLEGDLGSVFGAGGYVGCPDVADDLEPLDSKQGNPTAEPVRPVRPVRPPRPSLRAKEKAQSQTQGFDLK